MAVQRLPKIKRWLKERNPIGLGDNRTKFTKKAAHLGPPNNATMGEIPMTAANLYDQVRGTLHLTLQKKKAPEPIPSMADLIKEIQQGTGEVRAWATKAMISHYPDRFVILYKEREQLERGTHNHD